jgi:hypothetical protein
MTHIHPGGATRPAPVMRAGGPVHPQMVRGFDHRRLRQAIMDKRAQLAALEMSMVEVCEQDAARGLGHGVRIDERDTWDKATWDRYLTAATCHEPEYIPAMFRLLEEIERLERLMALPLLSSDIVE